MAPGDEAEAADHEHAEDDSHSEHSQEVIVEADNPAQLRQVAAAQLMMDNAGFQAMDERFNNEGGGIEAGDAVIVLRVARAVNETVWPEELQGQAAELGQLLGQYYQALADGDAEAAAPLAAKAHSFSTIYLPKSAPGSTPTAARPRRDGRARYGAHGRRRRA